MRPHESAFYIPADIEDISEMMRPSVYNQGALLQRSGDPLGIGKNESTSAFFRKKNREMWKRQKMKEYNLLGSNRFLKSKKIRLPRRWRSSQ
jgi:hypothetical protein